MTLSRDLDPQHAVDRIRRNAPTKKPVGGYDYDIRSDVVLSHVAQIGREELDAAHRMVRRLANRHNCQAPARLRALHATSIRPVNPAQLCDDPRHSDDVTAANTVLQMLGLTTESSTAEEAWDL